MSDKTVVIGSELAGAFAAKDKRAAELEGLLREALYIIPRGEFSYGDDEILAVLLPKINKALEGKQ